jgi:hypothetical protein
MEIPNIPNDDARCATILRQVVKNLKAQGQEGQSKAASVISTPTGNELVQLRKVLFTKRV